MANLRGGGSEYGEEWHRAGMRENKQNVFDDFIAVLEKLKKNGYKVAAWGGRSNGRLLSWSTLNNFFCPGGDHEEENYGNEC